MASDDLLIDDLDKIEHKIWRQPIAASRRTDPPAKNRQHFDRQRIQSWRKFSEVNVMDAWPPVSRRHKVRLARLHFFGIADAIATLQRSFAEMSQQVTLSPSPVLLMDSASSNFPSGSLYSSSANDSMPSIPTLSERRRTSHPHNQPIQFFNRQFDDMTDHPQSQQSRPRLEHRTSQTIIDLTDEPDIQIVASRNRSDHARSQRPPQLGRSDAEGLENFIDLTDDNDIIITGGRELPLPRPGVARPLPPHTQQARLRAESPPLFVPQQQDEPIRAVFTNGVGAAGGLAHALGAMIQRQGHRIPFHHIFHGAANIDVLHMHYHGPDQAMPANMDYQHGAFADRKPDHIPPDNARLGFTRSPKEGDVIICPSCEGELIHKKDVKEPVAKKGGKAPTRKEREEHPFWVIKQCGHVSGQTPPF